MSRTLCYVIIGYLSGSILYARVFEKLFHKENMIEGSKAVRTGILGLRMLLCVVVSGVVFLHYAVIWARALYRCSFIIREKCRSWGWH